MGRKEDVMRNYLAIPRCSVYPPNIQEEIKCAVGYGFDMGERFGKFGVYVEKQNDIIAEAIINHENDKLWEAELRGIKEDTDTPVNVRTLQLLSLIAEMILYTKIGG